MRRIRIALIALAVLLAAPAAARAQPPAGETATEAAAATQAGTPTAAPVPAAESAGPGYTPPRTLRAYTHVFAAFAIAWMLLFGYMVFVARKFRRVEEQLEALARA